MRPFSGVALSAFLFLVIGCGSGGPIRQTPSPEFSAASGAYPTAQTVTVTDAASNALIFYTTDGSTPTEASKRYTAPINVSVSQVIQAVAIAPVSTASNVASATYSIAPPVVSASSFSFGQNIVNNSVTNTVATITNSASASIPIMLSVTGDPSYTLLAAQSCGAQLGAGASCPIVVSYKPTAAGTQTATVRIAATPIVTVTGTSAPLSAGVVTPTQNPQVAQYVISPPFDASVSIQFGTDTSYGLTTASQASPSGGGPTSLYVAGMLAQTLYHMRAVVTLASGPTVTDIDHTFTTGSLPGNVSSGITVATTPGMTPQSGVEFLNAASGEYTNELVTDLAGNVIWAYYDWAAGHPITGIQGFKMLPNGHFVTVIGPGSQSLVSAPVPPGASVLREVDLAGNTIRQLDVQQLNARLAAAGFNLNVPGGFHHDVTVLPSGHWLVLVNTTRTYTDLPGYPGTTQVVGDVVIDLDPDLNPVWLWNEFDHLDVNRHPFMFPDWTHSNAIVYSPDDGNILVSSRHQSWVIKVDYANGQGAGDVLWRLGYEGDFTLLGGTDPTDWFYAQHNPSFFTNNTTGNFSLAVMDNGDSRVFASGIDCGTAGNPPCLYSTVPVIQIDESAKTATLQFHQVMPSPSLYNDFGGSVDMLQNGDIEYDLCDVPGGGQVFEVTPDNANPETVWHLTWPGTALYRAVRMPSLYPGVQW